LSVFIAIIGLAFLVFVHELGHFLTARAVGMRPRRFYIGFPPALAKTRRNGIEYGIGVIPLGGYVKIPGMHRVSASDADLYFGRTLRQAPELIGPTQRLKRALAAEDDDAARAAVSELRDLAGASPPEGLERGVEEILDGLSPEAYWRQRTWKRVAVILAGPATNLVFAVVLFACLFLVGGGKATRTVDQVLSGHPAAAIGLRPGDEVVAVNRVRVTARDIATRISASRGRPVTLLVQRGARLVTLGPVRPKFNKTDGVYQLGFRLRGEQLGVGASAWQSVKLTGIVTREIGKTLVRLVHGEGRKDIASPVGIVQGSSNALNEGIQTYLWVLGLISLSLALMNLLPLLPLDGGHIAFSLVEGLRGRAVAREVYERVSVVGIVLVVLLFFIGISNDVNRLGGS
jgi:regulator of sigma E protease